MQTGKSTVGKHLERLLPNSRFLEGDKFGFDDLALTNGNTRAALARIERKLLVLSKDYLIFAFPMKSEDHARMTLACRRRGTELFTVTLCPPMEVVLTEHGTRELTDYEEERIVQMYNEGYATRFFTDFFFDNSRWPPKQTASFIAERLTSNVP